MISWNGRPSSRGTRNAEIKTLYVAPRGRSRGLGSRILQRLLAEAQAQVRLETVSFMTDAIRLYRSFGFAQCPAYYEMPASLKPTTVFMARTL
jgi:ribosomal protein S18 acetylase RimI-like enzyme